MNLFDVYPLFDITPVRAQGCQVYDDQGREYMDLYGGHAVISIGHTHPHYVQRITEQLGKIGFYSNSVQMPIQQELADKLGRLSGLNNYQLFLCNSGAEANENALKLASFATGKNKVVAFSGSFHGRTSLAVEATDNPKIVAPVNQSGHVEFLPLNDLNALAGLSSRTDIAAIIIEGMQGVGGVMVPTVPFLQALRELCTRIGALLVLDEVQSGYGRSGKFFAFQHAGIQPDVISMAKGMGNGFPIGGILIAPHIQAKHGMLGTTFGGSHLACAAGLAVLEVLEQEQLMQHAATLGTYWMQQLAQLPGVAEVRGHGLMIGLQLDRPCGPIRQRLLAEHRIFTGSSSEPHTLRLLPPLSLTQQQADAFTQALLLTMSTDQ